ncbi:hypothetical protein NQZ68_029562 [Dissostichus eleginoides]|nr:hypothetical protein NQZ68_029562 [Dissostichus eleginoides]
MESCDYQGAPRVKEKDLEQREGTQMKKHFSAEETSEIILQPSSASELQDSSEEDTRIEGGSDTECSLESSSSSDPSSDGWMEFKVALSEENLNLKTLRELCFSE